MPGEGRDLSSRQTQDVARDLEIGQPGRCVSRGSAIIHIGTNPLWESRPVANCAAHETTSKPRGPPLLARDRGGDSASPSRRDGRQSSRRRRLRPALGIPANRRPAQAVSGRSISGPTRGRADLRPKIAANRNLGAQRIPESAHGDRRRVRLSSRQGATP
jgi:hypothetical protein